MVWLLAVALLLAVLFAGALAFAALERRGETPAMRRRVNPASGDYLATHESLLDRALGYFGRAVEANFASPGL